ncbi:MAG: hypothetical protein ACP5HU_01035 [Phycisphaerae bacterium]
MALQRIALALVLLLLSSAVCAQVDETELLRAENKALRAQARTLQQRIRSLERSIERLEQENERLRDRLERLGEGGAPVEAVPETSRQPTTGSTELSPSKYVVVPVTGTLGVDFTAELLEQCLQQARQEGAGTVVLDIDCPGGYADEAEKMLMCLRETEGLRVVAFVHRAGSEAGVLALGCPELVFRPGGMLGGPPVVRSLPWAEYTALAGHEKVVWRAKARSAVSAAGRPGVLAEALIDPRLTVHVETTADAEKVSEGIGERMLSRPGELLTVTGTEAAAVGAADGLAADYDELGVLLGVQDWSKASNSTEELVGRHRRDVNATRAEIREIIERYNRTLDEADAAESATGELREVSAAILLVKRVRHISQGCPEIRLCPVQLDAELEALASRSERLSAEGRHERMPEPPPPEKIPVIRP